jgi:hypothetical protein
VRLAFIELHAITFESVDEFLNVFAVETYVIDTARSGRAGG